MPDTFTNARAYYDPTFPSSGDSFSINALKNILQGLGFMDFLPLQPRAHNPGNMSIMVRGSDASGFYRPVYAGDNNTRIFFNSGDAPAMSAPVSNPRLDIIYLTPSGDIRIQSGSEAASPTLPSLSPSGDRLPVCAIYHKVGESKIVNYEDRNSNTGDGYIYQDLRPQYYSLAAGVQLTNSPAVSATGDNSIGVTTAAARSDHHHQGVHTVRVVGSGDIYGDIGLEGPGLSQSGNRIIIGNSRYATVKKLLSTDESFSSTTYINSSLVIQFNQSVDGLSFFDVSAIANIEGAIRTSFALVLDGQILDEFGLLDGTGNNDHPVSFSAARFCKAGSHTIALQYKVASSSASIDGGTASQARISATYPSLT